ncbi:UNVERIFIED_CONTAM: hypothetical protein Cloal_2846 [Acetivibrio alkalicellulosi]
MHNPFGIINKINITKPYQHYKHSGTLNLSSIFILLLLGTIGTLILSIIYSYAIHYIPLIALNVICTVFFGYFTGLIIGHSGKISKIRNNTVLIIYGIIFGLFAVYISWVVWLYELFQRQELIFNPVAILNIMQFLSIEGIWSTNSYTPTGFSIYVIWFVEAVIILCTTIYGAATFLKTNVFCEKCNAWVENKYILPNLNYTYNPTKLTNLIQQGQFSAISDLRVQEPASNLYTSVELSKCSKCNDLYLLKVNTIKLILKSNGNVKRDETIIVENMIIDSEIYNSIKTWGEERS